MGKTFDDRSIERIANVVRTVERQNTAGQFEGHGSFVMFSFALREDMSGTSAIAEIQSADGASVIQPNGQLTHRFGLLTGAQAGYEGFCFPFRDYFMFYQGPCVTTCDTTGSLTVGTAPSGTAGAAYPGHTVSGSGLTAGSFGATGLPPGLTIDATTGAISGTLAGGSEGTYYPAITATAPETGGGSCTLTSVLPITIGV